MLLVRCPWSRETAAAPAEAVATEQPKEEAVPTIDAVITAAAGATSDDADDAEAAALQVDFSHPEHLLGVSIYVH